MNGSASWEQLRGGEVWQLFARKIGPDFVRLVHENPNTIHKLRSQFT
jgi:hypothetical protein